MRGIPEITIEEVIARYSVLLLDAYGVLAHSEGALPGAAELISRLNRMGKPYYMLTNDASMLPTSRARRYQGYGLPIPPERIITSGGLLKGYFEANNLKGTRCVVLGPDDSARYVEDAGGLVVGHTEDFDVFVIGDQGGFPFLETVDSVLSTLFHKLDCKEKPHLVLPNPDLIYPAANHGFGFASGSVALIFEAALGLRYPNRSDLRFVRLGKPYSAIFEEALRRSGTRDMVMIGDQIETDIRGANAFGLDSVLIETGVTSPDMSMISEDLRPTYRMRSLASWG